MTSLRIDDAVLAELYRSMNLIRSTLDDAGGLARNDEKAAGDDALAEQLRLFADDWRKTRRKMLGEIDRFQGMVQNVVESFAQTDASLAQALVPPDPRGTIAGTRG